MRKSFIEKVKATIKKYHLISPDARILIALSGGPDSLCLLYVLLELRKDFSYQLAVAHLDHGIRAESKQDLEFIKELTAKLKLKLFSKETNTADFAQKNNLCLEEAARNLRYQFLLTTAKENSFNTIALGHNKNDQVETFLMRLIRGAGIKGLSAMDALREVNGIKLIRPLINCWRSEIEQFLHLIKVKPCIDSSNYDTNFLRNRIRHELIPLLKEKYNPNIEEVLSHTIDNIKLLTAWLQMELKNKSHKCIKETDSHLILKLPRLYQLHPALQRELIRYAINRFKGDLRRIEYSHWREIEELLKSRPLGSVVDLPQGISLKKEKDVIHIYRRR